MVNKVLSVINKMIEVTGYRISSVASHKYHAELEFWKNELLVYQKWYDNKIAMHYGEPAPKDEDKVKMYSHKDSAILTWFKIHQQTKYIEDLSLEKNEFSRMKILDVGSGPFPSALAFEGCELYCIDPLIPCYIKVGFPIHYYDNVKFICGFSEDIPIEDDFFDAVISVNAIDHVDDLFKTSLEIKRVLKPNGKLRMHIHYHKKTQTEPIELNDEVVKSAFGWCINFRKIKESKAKRGTILDSEDESYTLWSN